MSMRMVTWVAIAGLAWTVGAQPVRACSYANEYLGANPPSESTLPSGEVYVALRYSFAHQPTEAFHVINGDGDEIPVTVAAVAGAFLLQFDTTGAEQVSIVETLGESDEEVLATYDVSLDAPDADVPTAPIVALGEATCEACPEPLDSCCSRHDTEGRLTTPVSITRTQEGTILGWTNDGTHLAGVLTQGTYQSAPAYGGPGIGLPVGVDIVAMSVAGVLSPAVSWTLEESGPCEAPEEVAPTPTLKEGCAVSPGSQSHAAIVCVSLGLLLVLRRRRRPSASC